MNQSASKTPNKLINEKSPYLLQHAYNPVDWYPWSDKAFAKAKKENKPIFLSIGYSTCHWCHVMERESFEDAEVAKVMNDSFISIKVDREERPDIDNIYMRVCQIVTGRGGWPLTIVMTPDKEPFFAGTYFSKETKYGRPGIIDLLTQLNEIWTTRQSDITKAVNEILEHLKSKSESGDTVSLDKSLLDKAFQDLQHQFDNEHGGFGNSPKFPIPHNLMFLLRYAAATGSEEAQVIVNKTLTEMRNGGIYDHVGLGFHRYSTDRHWLLPHFEKMLYDQALLAMAYTEAFQMNKNNLFKETALQIFEYVLRDMTSPEGGFYSAEDADSEGVEGKFYTWSKDEINKLLSHEEAELFIEVYNIANDGNFKDESTRTLSGVNIPHLTKSTSEIAETKNIPHEELIKQLNTIREKLFNTRDKRIHPLKDDKILTDWNGLMMAALAKASRVFDNEKLLSSAKKASNFIYDKMLTANNQLLHRYKDSSAEINANAEDYAFLTWGMLELYETTFDTKYLEQAIQLTDIFIKHFWDSNAGGFYFTSDYSEKLLIRSKEIYDGAIPSANSVALSNLIRLSRITGETKYDEYTDKLVKAFSKEISRMPSVYTQFLSGFGLIVGDSFEVVIVGHRDSPETKQIIVGLNNYFTPNKVCIFIPADDANNSIRTLAPYTENYEMINGKTTVYVCRNHQCNLPTNDIDEVLKQLQE